MKTLIGYLSNINDINEGFKLGDDNFKIGNEKEKSYDENKIIDNIEDLVKELSMVFEVKPKAIKNPGVLFGNWGDYGANTIVRKCYEMMLPDELSLSSKPKKIQIGIVDYVTKEWMEKSIRKNEVIFRTCIKQKNLAGKEVFKWRSDGLESYPLSQPLKVYMDKIKTRLEKI